jgi:hypothetical protein
MLRWRSDDALRIYARINGFKYAEWVDSAGSATIASVRTTTAADSLADMMQTTANGPTATAEAGFVDWWLARAQNTASDETVAAHANIPRTNADDAVAAFEESGAALLAAAERADIEDGCSEE